MCFFFKTHNPCLAQRAGISALHGKGPDNSLLPTSRNRTPPSAFSARGYFFHFVSYPTGDMTLHDTGPHQHDYPPRVRPLPQLLTATHRFPQQALKEPTPTKFNIELYNFDNYFVGTQMLCNDKMIFIIHELLNSCTSSFNSFLLTNRFCFCFLFD
jgi:hypothetical protein